LSQCGHFADKGGGGHFFAILCGRLLWTAPSEKSSRWGTKHFWETSVVGTLEPILRMSGRTGNG